MASLGDRQTMDAMWRIIARDAGFSEPAGFPWDLFGMGSNGAVTTNSFTIFVDSVNGDDGNEGTVSKPLASIVAAIAKVPKRLHHLVKVQVAAGNYAGFIISGFTVDPMLDGTLAGLQIFGSTGPVTPATGTATGTITSVTASVAATASFVIFNDTNQTWTVNDLQKKYVQLTKGWATFTMSGVLAADTVTINGQVFTAVSGAPGLNQFDCSGTDAQTAASLTNAINTSTSVLIVGIVTAITNGTVTTALSNPSAGGLGSLSSNSGRIATASSTFQGGNQINAILSNTSNSLTVPLLANTAAQGVPYVIIDNTSIINTPVLLSATLVQPGIAQQAAATAGIAFISNYGPAQTSNFRVEQFKVAISTGFPTELLVINPIGNPTFAHLTLASTVGRPVTGRGTGRFTLNQSIVDHPSAATCISVGASNTVDACGLTVSSCYLKCLGNGAASFSLGGGSAGTLLNNILCETDTMGAVAGPCWVQFSGIIKKTFSSNSNFGLRSVTNDSTPGGVYMHLVTGSGMEISNCANSTALSLSRASTFIAEGTLIGTNNLIGTLLEKGARVQMSAASTITGTTEVSIDGTVSTLATMRAASPKLVNSPYGSVIFE